MQIVLSFVLFGSPGLIVVVFLLSLWGKYTLILSGEKLYNFMLHFLFR